jgi:hypothetical protein
MLPICDLEIRCRSMISKRLVWVNLISTTLRRERRNDLGAISQRTFELGAASRGLPLTAKRVSFDSGVRV